MDWVGGCGRGASRLEGGRSLKRASGRNRHSGPRPAYPQQRRRQRASASAKPRFPRRCFLRPSIAASQTPIRPVHLPQGLLSPRSRSLLRQSVNAQQPPVMPAPSARPRCSTQPPFLCDRPRPSLPAPALQRQACACLSRTCVLLAQPITRLWESCVAASTLFHRRFGCEPVVGTILRRTTAHSPVHALGSLSGEDPILCADRAAAAAARTLSTGGAALLELVGEAIPVLPSRVPAAARRRSIDVESARVNKRRRSLRRHLRNAEGPIVRWPPTLSISLDPGRLPSRGSALSTRPHPGSTSTARAASSTREQVQTTGLSRRTPARETDPSPRRRPVPCARLPPRRRAISNTAAAAVRRGAARPDNRAVGLAVQNP